MGALPQEVTVEVPSGSANHLLSEWSWLIHEPMTVEAISVLGDAFLSNSSGQIFWLDASSGTVLEIAATAAQFEQLKNDPRTVEQLFMPPLVAQLTSLYGPVPKGSCFSITIPLTLGGKLEPGNFRVMDIAAHFRALAKIQEQASQLPVGTKIDRVQLEK